MFLTRGRSCTPRLHLVSCLRPGGIYLAASYCIFWSDGKGVVTRESFLQSCSDAL